MNSKQRLFLAFLISLITLLGFVLVSYLVRVDQVLTFDTMIIQFVQQFEAPLITKIMLFFSYMGDTTRVIILMGLIMVFLYKVLHHRLELILLTGVMIGTVLLNQIAKYAFQRARPEINQLISETGYSFPSGHSMAAFSLYGIVTYLLWRHISTRTGRTLLLVASSLMIILIGLSRIYLGVHYPSDVLGAYLASGFWLFMAIWFYESDFHYPFKK